MNMTQGYAKGIFQEYDKGICQEYGKGGKTIHTPPIAKLTPMPKYMKIQKKIPYYKDYTKMIRLICLFSFFFSKDIYR